MIGRIYKIAGTDCEVRAGEVLLRCRFRGRLRKQRQPTGKLAAVGDMVEVTPTGAGEGAIEGVFPRRSKFSRRDILRPSVEQVIVANVDYLVIVQSARDPDFNEIVADKCTVMAAANGLPCVVCLNKIDLGRPDLSAYERAGFACVRTSARTGEGLEDLRRAMKGRTSVFLGPSGVGKSSLLNALEPGSRLKVGEVSRHGEGRHTTSWVELMDAGGGVAADTPGLEFFTLWGVTAENLKDMFLDFADMAGGCRFRNCSHTVEEGCAVRGRVAESRYRSYREILEDLQARRDVFRKG